jgi:hypothetical protein
VSTVKAVGLHEAFDSTATVIHHPSQEDQS